MKRGSLASITLLGLAACGGLSSGESGSGGAGMPGSGGGAGTGNVAGVPSSAGAGGSAGRVNRNERVACFYWSDVMNEPKPGQTGSLACPQYSDIEWVGSLGNCFTTADPAPVPPEPGGAQGDCCYHYTYFECR